MIELVGRRVQNIEAHERPGDFSWPERRVAILLSCPACGQLHGVPVKGENPDGWTWDGNEDKPTLTPSIYFASGHLQHGADNGCRWHGWLRAGVFVDA